MRILQLKKTSVSNCAALASASAVNTSDLFTRMLLIFVFLILYLIFAILFGIRLDQWDNNVPGRCYEAGALSLPNSKHPHVAKIYLGITCLFMFVSLHLTLVMAVSRCKAHSAWVKRYAAVLFPVNLDRGTLTDYFSAFSLPRSLKQWVVKPGLNSRIWCSSIWSSRVWYPLKVLLASAKINPVLTIAMLQLPLHLYFIICIRIDNEPLLLNGSDENRWGFGQIYVLVTSAAPVVQCFKGYVSK